VLGDEGTAEDEGTVGRPQASFSDISRLVAESREAGQQVVVEDHLDEATRHTGVGWTHGVPGGPGGTDQRA
jgi:hypothetical protein